MAKHKSRKAVHEKDRRILTPNHGGDVDAPSPRDRLLNTDEVRHFESAAEDYSLFRLPVTDDTFLPDGDDNGFLRGRYRGDEFGDQSDRTGARAPSEHAQIKNRWQTEEHGNSGWRDDLLGSLPTARRADVAHPERRATRRKDAHACGQTATKPTKLP